MSSIFSKNKSKLVVNWPTVIDNAELIIESRMQLGGGLIGYVKSKLLGNGQIISIDVLVIVMIIAVFHRKLI